MSYAVAFQSGARRSGLASSTACVIWHGGVSDRLALYGSFDYATVVGSTFTFFRAGHGTVAAVSLTAETLVSSVVGGSVLIDDGTANWRLATVAGDGSSASVGGQTVASTARAGVAIGDNGQYLPIGATLTLTGTASDGKVWFSTGANTLKTYVTAALTTVGALSSGTVAAVEMPNGTWIVGQI